MIETYVIHRWDMVTHDSVQYPVVSIIVDKKLLRHIQDHNFTIDVSVDSTQSLYDNTSVRATCKPSANVFGYRPHFHDKYNYIMCTLHAPWMGYPVSLGVLKIDIDVKESFKPIDDTLIPLDTGYNNGYNNKYNDEYNLPPPTTIKHPECDVRLYVLIIIVIIFLFISVLKNKY